MFELGMKSHQGKVRQINEDSFHVDMGELDGEEYALLAVADGMGGHRAGEVASKIAIDCFSNEFFSVFREETSSLLALEIAVRRSNQKVYDLAESDYLLAGMGTTLTVALLWRKQLLIAHVGDSRLYLCRGASCRQLTNDHSLVGELVKSGGLSEEEAQQHPQRNLILRALGTDPFVEMDLLTFDIQPGDVVLLCSDGLSTELSKAELAGIIGGNRNLQQAAEEMVETANNRGGLDNITAVMAKWGWEPV